MGSFWSRDSALPSKEEFRTLSAGRKEALVLELWQLEAGGREGGRQGAEAEELVPAMGAAAAKGARGRLVGALKSLEEEALQLFRGRLQELPPQPGFPRIPEQQLQEASAVELSDLLLDCYSSDHALEVAAELLQAIDCPRQARRLLQGASRGGGGEGEAEYLEYLWEDDICDLCHREKNFSENTTSQVLSSPQGSRQTYRLYSSGAGSLHCCFTKLRFEVKSAVTITYKCESWHKHQQSLSTHHLIAVGPLLDIHADPVEAVIAVYFPHFLYIAAGKGSSQVRIAHFAEEEMSLEKPASVESSHVVWTNPRFSPCGVVLRKSFFKRKIKVHAVALLYQVPGTSVPKFHLYLLPNDSLVRKAVHDYELTCHSQRVPKSSGTHKPLTLGSHFFVQRLKDLTISPRELELRYLDAEMEQQYLELYAEYMPDRLELRLIEKKKEELIWEAWVRREELIQFPVLQQKQETVPSVPPEQHFVDLHREQLIQRTKTVAAVLDVLHGTILDDEQYQKISSKDTSHEQMRELYNLVPSWNLSCKDKLYEALQMKNPHLIQDLGGV